MKQGRERPQPARPAARAWRWLSALLLSGFAAAAPAADAQRPQAAAKAPAVEAGGPAWSTLTPQQKQALAPLERDWAQIDGPRKTKWLEVAARLPSMPPEERSRVQQRMTEWARMTPAERGRARLVFQEVKQLSPQERQQRWEAYQALPDEQRRALADRGKRSPERPGAASAPPAPPLAQAVPKTSATSASRASGPQVKPVAPTVVQAKPGATTRLMTTPPSPPPHQRPGQPIIAAKPGEVDRHTLLPRSGPQAAASTPRQP